MNRADGGPETPRAVALADLAANGGPTGRLALLRGWIYEPGFAAVRLYRRAAQLRPTHPRLSRLLWRLNVLVSACHLHPDSRIGPGLGLPHPTGIVIGSGVRIGRGVTIYQNVTVGRGRDGYPSIGSGVTIYPGAVLIGAITVGDGATIGANSVVLADVPAGATVAGSPARPVGVARGELEPVSNPAG